MPGPLAGPLLAAGTQLASGALNAFTTGKATRRARRYALEMWKYNRDAALEDWYRQTNYDSPMAQMNRLKQAGLNPNLFYGEGVGAMNSPGIKSAGGDMPQVNPPDLSNVGETVSSFYDTRMKDAQANLLQKQQSIADQELKNKQVDSLLKQAQLKNLGVVTDTKTFDLNMKNRLSDIYADQAEANLRNTIARTKLTLDNNERQVMLAGQSIRESVERILRSRAERGLIPLRGRELEARIRDLSNSADLKYIDKVMKEKGFSWSDPWYMRVGANIVDGATKMFGGSAPKDLYRMYKGSQNPFFPFP